jgi:hypothetical protein
MAIIGSADLWADFFPDDLIPKILDMVLDVWSSFTKPAFDEHEVQITKRFRAWLEQYKDLKRLPVRIDREVPIDDLERAEELGRIDLRLTHGYRSDVYFAFECKRLNIIRNNGSTESLAKDYVVDGMMRFMGSTPQYARGLTQGGMIGYVMNNKVENAIDAVDKRVRNHYSELQMESSTGLSPSSRSSNDLIKESLHHLESREFTLHHVFLSVG